MTATTLFPYAAWLEGTNQNSTPANDNSLRTLAAFGPAINFSDVEPSGPSNYDSYVIRTAWGGHSDGNVVVWLAGAWKEFASYQGQIKAIDGLPYTFIGSAWHPLLSGS